MIAALVFQDIKDRVSGLGGEQKSSEQEHSAYLRSRFHLSFISTYRKKKKRKSAVTY